jgi:predicted DNA-binding ribbon-helix-helix protein
MVRQKRECIGGQGMIRKTMRVGEVRTSIKLESEFWSYLKEVADSRRLRISALVNEVARATPDRTNLASTLRTFALIHAKLRAQSVQGELDKLALAGNTQDLARVLEACPLPCLVLDHERVVRELNRAFAIWLNLDPQATAGLRLDNIMILRGPAMKEMWASLGDGRLARAAFNATYVSPGKVRTAQAIAIALSADGHGTSRGSIVMFETLAGRS